MSRTLETFLSDVLLRLNEVAEDFGVSNERLHYLMVGVFAVVRDFAR